MAGYPPPSGFTYNPNASAGYPPPAQGGYPPGQGGYPPAQGGYPPAQGGYPPAQGGYPPAQGGYPPAQGGYPPAQGGYPPQGGQMYSQQGPANYPPPGGQPGYGGAPPQGYGTPQFMGPGAAHGTAGPYAGAGGMGSFSPYYGGRPTVFAMANFDPGQDADNLRKAMRGMGTDEAGIISVLAKRTSHQRSIISKKYKASFGKDLEKHLKSELSGKFEDLVLLSLQPLPEMLASTMYEAIKGAGTDERVLIQALVPYSNAIISQIGQAYKDRFKRDVMEDVRGDTCGDFEKILICLLQAQREENTAVDMARAAADADALYQAGEKRIGTEEAVFTRILTQRSFEQIKAISSCYQQKYNKSLEKAIQKETSGNYKETMVAIVRFAEDKNSLLADWFRDSMAGAGTRDKALMQLVLGRCEIDLQDVKDAYQRKYGKSLVKAIEGDTSGDYRKMFAALVGP